MQGCTNNAPRQGYKHRAWPALPSKPRRAVCQERIFTGITQNEMKNIISMKAPQGLTTGLFDSVGFSPSALKSVELDPAGPPRASRGCSACADVAGAGCGESVFWLRNWMGPKRSDFRFDFCHRFPVRPWESPLSAGVRPQPRTTSTTSFLVSNSTSGEAGRGTSCSQCPGAG